MKVAGSVVVVTGASSGLGRALALELAEQGAALALAARGAPALEEVAGQCRDRGADVIVVPTDVTQEAEVHALAAAVMARWDRIDVWVNNAGVTLYALLEDGPFERHRRVLETNLFGPIFGARAVVPIFRRQHRGILINVGSILSEVGQAFVPSYVISKFGVRGLSEALSVELADEPDIHVCTVLPYAIDTPHFQVAANSLGRAPYAMPPVQSPERVARAIAGLIERPRRMRHVPRYLRLGVLVHALIPRTAERLLRDALERWHLRERQEVRDTGNLYAAPATQDEKVHGDRPPQIGTPALLAWLAMRFGKTALGRLAGRG